MLPIKELLGITALIALTACSRHITQQTAMPNTLTSTEKKAGWQLLFDGHSYDGWHKYGGAPIGSAWIIKDSSIYLDAAAKKANPQINEGGDIVTNTTFTDFHLTYDWKIDIGGNSGVIFYVHEDTSKFSYPWQTGPEMQVLDNERHADAKIHKHRAGDLYDLIASSTEPAKPALQWNHAEIISVKGQLDLYLNGVLVVSTQLWNDNWKALIAGSKFKDMPGFGSYTSGKISLQDHGDGVWFRNIRIRKL